MRTWRQFENGEPRDVLRLDDVDDPEPGDGEILVAPAVVGISMPDLLLVRGGYQSTPTFPFTVGSELAGTVIATGPASPYSVGEHVMGTGGRPGGLSEAVVVQERLANRVPDGVSLTTAASIPVNYVTAYLALHTRAKLAEGETVLVQGGAGGVGSAAVQLARAAGARVFATAIDEPRAEACRALGAELVWDPARDDVPAAVMEATGGAGVDVAVDPVGGDAFDQTRRCMGFEGRLVVIGFVAGRIAELKTNALVLRNFGVLGINNSMYMARRPEVHDRVREDCLALAAEGRIAPLIAATWPFDQAPEALAQLGAGALVGKALVTL